LTAEEKPLFLLMSVRDGIEATAEQTIKSLLDQGWYVLRPDAPYRLRIKAGTRVCFYAKGIGVVAEATAAGPVERREIRFARRHELFPYAFPVGRERYFFDKPVVIDVNLRRRLDAFKDKNPAGKWAFLVQNPRELTEHDFKVMTGSR
jgi:hypothetical protein